MGWKQTLNGALARTTGYELRRRGTPAQAAGTGERLVRAPIFVLCTVRSGSTLLRVILNSHPELYAPHELHLRYTRVKLTRKLSRQAMRELGLGEKKLEYYLWDRILHRLLAKSGKRHIVSKTPNSVFIADRIAECWPDAKLVFLLRHPGSIARSLLEIPGGDRQKKLALARRYVEALDEAHRTLPGHTVRYEELTADPERAVRGICEYLGVAWDPAMLDYGRHEHGPFRSGLGDFTEKIRSGRVQRPRALPTFEETPPELRPIAEAWGYLTADEPLETRTG